MTKQKVAKEFANAYEAGFIQGVEYGNSHKWINLKEEKPTVDDESGISEWLFIKKDDGGHTIGLMFKDGHFSEAHTGTLITNVSHWMPTE